MLRAILTSVTLPEDGSIVSAITPAPVRCRERASNEYSGLGAESTIAFAVAGERTGARDGLAVAVAEASAAQVDAIVRSTAIALNTVAFILENVWLGGIVVVHSPVQP